MTADGIIELRSDTFTQPTDAMWEALDRPPLGDDISQEDPTVARLERRAASLLGKEDALLAISGTMANQVAVMTLTERGDEVIVSDRSHIYNLEVAALAALCQVQARPVHSADGQFDSAQISSLIRSPGIQAPKTGLICLENTHDLNQGIPVTLENMRRVGELSRDAGVPIYLDGARIFNAAAALEVDAGELTQDASLVQVCLTKGLGAPLGSVLAGTQETIGRARHMKQRLGGGMRQAGIIAAPGLVALGDERIAALREDHRRARVLRAALREVEGLDVYPRATLTNIVKIQLDAALDAGRFHSGLKRRGIRIKPVGGAAFRMVTHHQVSDEDISVTVCAIREVLTTCG